MTDYILRLAVIIASASPVYLLLRRPWRRPGRTREWALALFWLFTFALLASPLRGIGSHRSECLPPRRSDNYNGNGNCGCGCGC